MLLDIPTDAGLMSSEVLSQWTLYLSFQKERESRLKWMYHLKDFSDRDWILGMKLHLLDAGGCKDDAVHIKPLVQIKYRASKFILPIVSYVM